MKVCNTDMPYAPKHALGLDFVDHDHAALEQMFEAVGATGGDELRALAERIVDETAAHFAREEDFMREIDFPGLHCHAAQHRMLLTELHRTSPGDEQTRRRIGVLVPQLVLSHVITMDRMMVEFARGDLSKADFETLRLPLPGSA